MAAPSEHWEAIERAISDIGTLAGHANRYCFVRARGGADLLDTALALAHDARRLYSRRAAGDGAAGRLAARLTEIADVYHALLDAAREAPAYHQAAAAWAAADGARLALLMPQVFTDLSLAADATSLYYPVSVAGRESRLVEPDALAGQLHTLLADGIPACEPEDCAVTDDLLRAVPLYDAWDALDTPVAIRLEPRALGVPLFRVGTSAQLVVYTARLTATGDVALAWLPGADHWPHVGADYADFAASLTAALAGLGHTAALVAC